MPYTQIDRITIEAKGLSPDESRKLAVLVAAGLDKSASQLMTHHLASLRLEIDAPLDATIEELAQRAIRQAAFELRGARETPNGDA